MKVIDLKRYLELVDDETEVKIGIAKTDQMDDSSFNYVTQAISVEVATKLFVINGVDE